METIKTLSTEPFRHFVTTIGELPTSFTESMSYYELLAWLCNYLEKTIIPAVNDNAEAVKELQDAFVELKSYVDNYFENLDIQEEVDNKLDEMAESGQLAELIAQYINAQVIQAFENVADMKTSVILNNGSLVETYGYAAKGDGGGAKYFVRTVTTSDVIDDKFILSLADVNLVAELIVTSPMSVKKFGAKGDDATDDTAAIQTAINKCLEKGVACYIPEGTYLISKLSISNKIDLYGDGTKSVLKSIANNTESVLVDVKDAGIAFSQFHDFMIDGNARNNSSAVDCLSLTVTNASYAGDLYANLYNIRITNFSGDGVVFDCLVTGALKEMRTRNVTAIGGRGYGFRINNTSDSIFTECTAAGTTKAGYSITNGGSLKLLNCKAFWCGIGDGVTREDANRIPASAFSITADASPVAGKTYYTRSGANVENDYYVFTEFTGSSFVGGTTYYELSTFYSKRYAGFILNGTEFLVSNCESQDNFGDGFVVSGSESKFVNTSCDNNGLIIVNGEPVSYASQSKTQLYYGIYLSGWQFSAENCCFMNHQNATIGKCQKSPAFIVGGGYITINGTESNQVINPIQIQGLSDPLIVSSKINNREWVYDLPISRYLSVVNGYELVDSDMNYLRCDNNTLKFQLAIKKSNNTGMLNGTTTIYFATLNSRIRSATRQCVTAFATDNYGYMIGGFVTGILESSGAFGARYVDTSLNIYKQIVVKGEIRIKD